MTAAMTDENPLLTMIREVCALGRAEFERPRTPDGDGDAQRPLVARLRALEPEGEASDISLSLALLAPRAPYFDQLVLDAVATDMAQIVNLGAGYDDRALRFRNPGTTHFELDLVDVIADKTQRLTELGADLTGVHLAAIDLARDDVAQVLDDIGHDTDRPTLFLAEHLALFLEPSDVTRLVRGIASRAAVGSSFALTAETHPDGLDSAEVIAEVDSVMFGGAGPVRTIWSAPQWEVVLNAAGWVSQDVERLVVDHFAFPLAGRTMQVQTRFITTTIGSTVGTSR